MAALALAPSAALAPVMALRLQPPRLDRIVRGRAWIPVLAALLLGIVGLRVEVLKLGSSVGSQIEQATLLQSSNSVLRSEISALSDNRRIEALAGRYGMHMPDPLAVHFVQASAGRHLRAAMRNIATPAPSTFLSGLAAEQQADASSAQRIAALNGVAVTAPPTGGGASTSTANSSSTAAAGGTGTATGGAAPTTSTGSSAPAGGGSGTSGTTAGTSAGASAGSSSSLASAGTTAAAPSGATATSATSSGVGGAVSTAAGPPAAGSTNGGAGLGG